MRTFVAANGSSWVADAVEQPGVDYKGRWVLVFRPEGAAADRVIELADVRWNGRETAERTLGTMSDVELRRRLRTALGRSEGIPAREA